MDWTILLPAAVVPFAAVAVLLRPLTAYLKRRAILDHPVDRSSHTVPTPKGAGLAVVPVSAACWVAVDGISGFGTMTAIAGLALIICTVSWIDDLRSLSAAVRLAVHLACATAAVGLFAGDTLVFQGMMPPRADHAASVLLLVWFVNLFNFMDGIDGISGGELLVCSAGIVAIAGSSFLGAPAAVLFGAAAGLLIWNWHPAKVFLGDAGSAPLGFLLGWLLLELARAGAWEAALILPLYYLADATITLGRRALRGERVWQAHREHFYQHAVAAGRSHGAVTRDVMIAGSLLIGCALIADRVSGIAGLLMALLVTAGFLGYLGRRER